ncbi:MAG: hypothetical protein QM831_25640 [Kofleriaceae bacterium]
MNEEPSLAVALERERDVSAALRRAIENVIARADAASIAAVVELLDDHDDLYRAIAFHHPAPLIEALLPGSDLSNIAVRVWFPYKLTPGEADLWLHRGGDVTVWTERGARAIREMSRETRARITSISGKLDLLGRVELDGVTRLDLRSDSLNPVRRILSCPSLREYSGPLDREIAAALETTLVRQIYPSGPCPDAALDALARIATLETFYVSDATSRGIAQLARYPALTELHVDGELSDADIAAIAGCARLQKLFIPDMHSFTDRGGVALAQLKALRILDVHSTAVGEDTVIAAPRSRRSGSLRYATRERCASSGSAATSAKTSRLPPKPSRACRSSTTMIPRAALSSAAT